MQFNNYIVKSPVIGLNSTIAILHPCSPPESDESAHPNLLNRLKTSTLLKGKPRQMRLARGLWSFANFAKFLADCKARLKMAPTLYGPPLNVMSQWCSFVTISQPMGHVWLFDRFPSHPLVADMSAVCS